MTSYPKIYNLGHKHLENLFEKDDAVVVQEKLDGSQFTFGINAELGLFCKSKRTDIDLTDPQKLFARAVRWVIGNQDKLVPGHVYRAEAIHAPKHNVLTYDTSPDCGFVLFDVETMRGFSTPYQVRIFAEVLQVPYVRSEGVPGFKITQEYIDEQMALPSMWGGSREGLVFKNYWQPGPFGASVLMGKHVSEKFKEKHRKDSKWSPSKDFIKDLGTKYCTEARWQKAYQHLLEEGKISFEPKDIALLMKEVNCDLQQECADEIRDELFAKFWKKVSKGATNGLAQWYKTKLVEMQFDGE